MFTLGLVLAPIAFGQSLWLKDILQFTYPQKLYLRSRLLVGELPLWWREVGLGRPFLGMVQPGVLYPGNLVLLLPPPFGLDLFTGLHLFVAGGGMRSWLRRTGVGEWPSTAGGLILALSGYVLSMMAANGVYLYSVAWVPWILAAGAVPAEGARARAAQAARIALLLALAISAGDPQAVLFALFALAAQALARADRKQVGFALATVAGAAALAALVALVQLLPGLEVAQVGRPGGVPIEDASHFALHPARLVELIWPGAFGEPYSPRWFVHALVDEGSGVAYDPLCAGIYLGLATPFLALCALARPGRRRLDVALALLGLGALVIALGDYAPLWRPFFRFFPGVRLFRYPEKYLFLTSLCAAALAARGLDVLAAAPRRFLAGAAVVFALALALALAGRFAGARIALALVGRLGAVSPSEAGQVIATRAASAALVACAFSLPLVLAVRGRLTGPRLAAVLTALVAVDLCAANLRLVDWAPAWVYTQRPPLADDVTALAGARLDEQRLYRPLQLDPGRGADQPGGDAWRLRATLAPNCGTELGISQLDSYEAFHSQRETRLRATLLSRPLRLLQLTATSLAFVDDQRLGAAHPGLVMRKRYGRLGVSLVEIEGAAPRAYLVERALPARGPDDAAAQLLQPELTAGRDAVIEGAEPRTATGHCALTTLRAESVELTCDASAPAYAVIADGFFPGWRARVNDTPAPILPANLALRAVPIPAGASRVELRYRPSGLRAGLFGTLIGLALAAVLILRGRRRSPAT